VCLKHIFIAVLSKIIDLLSGATSKKWIIVGTKAGIRRCPPNPGDEIAPPYLVVCDSLFQRHTLAYETLYFQGYERVLRLISRLTVVSQPRLQATILDLSAYTFILKPIAYLPMTPLLSAKLTTLVTVVIATELLIS
jgi:hypothetical protein